VQTIGAADSTILPAPTKRTSRRANSDSGSVMMKRTFIDRGWPTQLWRWSCLTLLTMSMSENATWRSLNSIVSGAAEICDAWRWSAASGCRQGG
jgi:hypothetical protein